MSWANFHRILQTKQAWSRTCRLLAVWRCSTLLLPVLPSAAALLCTIGQHLPASRRRLLPILRRRPVWRCTGGCSTSCTIESACGLLERRSAEMCSTSVRSMLQTLVVL